MRSLILRRLGILLRPSQTRCGDAFLEAFIASKAKGFNDKEALERANLAGALKATKPETRGSPFEDELKKYLEFIEHGEILNDLGISSQSQSIMCGTHGLV